MVNARTPDSATRLAALAGGLAAKGLLNLAAAGGPLTPMAGWEMPAGERGSVEFRAAKLDESVQQGKYFLTIAGSLQGAQMAVLVVDGFYTGVEGRNDALILEGWLYDEQETRLHIAAPYVFPKDGQPFSVLNAAIIEAKPPGRESELLAAYQAGFSSGQPIPDSATNPAVEMKVSAVAATPPAPVQPVAEAPRSQVAEEADGASMRALVELAGFMAAHGMWTLADGPLTPVAAYELSDGSHGLVRFVAETLEAGAEHGRQYLASSPHDVVRAVTIAEGFHSTEHSKTSALIVEGRQYGEGGGGLAVAIPYRAATTDTSLVIQHPELVRFDAVGAQFNLLDAFFDGLRDHGPASDFWDQHQESTAATQRV